MFEFRVKGVPLVLFPGAEAGTEFQHPIAAEELGDAFTMPLEVPVRGNEEVLGNVHELALAERNIRIDGVEFWRRGELAHRGVFYVQGSSDGPEGTVSLSFSVDAFISSMAGKELREVDYGPDILLPGEGELIADAVAKNALAYPAARYCYPMLYNPQAYGGANKAWYREGSPFDPAISYAVGSYIQWESGSTVRRTQVYRANALTSPNENPDNTPEKWDLVKQAIINPSISNGTDFLLNDEENNCTMCPQFYLKDILARAMLAQGYAAQGAFMADAHTHRLILHNNHLLDRAAENTDLLVSQAGTLTYIPGEANYGRIVFTDETTAPNADPDNIHDVFTGQVELTVESWYRFRLHVRVRTRAACRIKVEAVWVATGNVFMSGISGSSSGDVRTQWEFTWQNSRYMQGGELNEPFYFRLRTVIDGNDPDPPTYSMAISEGWLQVARGTGDPTNVYATAIRPANHVPDITIEQLLLELRDLLHLRITPLPDQGIVRFDYQQDILDRPVTKDITALLRSPMRFDHTARTNGVRLKNATGRAEELPDLSAHLDYGNVISEEFELGAPGADLQKVYVRSTGEQLVARLYDTNQYAWYPAGFLNPDAEVGDPMDAREVAPELGIPGMATIPSHGGGVCLMPVVEERCSGEMYSLGNNAPTLLLYFYHGLQPNSSAENYPLASPYRWNQMGTEVGELNLNYDPADAKSLYNKRWKRWLDLLVQAEVVEVDVDITTLITPQGVPLERFMARNQVVLFDLMPVRDTNRPGPLLSTARLIKLPSV